MIKSLMDELAEMGKKDTSEFWEHLKHLCSAGLITGSEVHYMMGKACGYNECCIKNFINLNVLGIPAAGFMTFVLGHKDIPGVHHVLCPICYEKHLEEYGYPEQYLESPIFGKEGMPSTEENVWTKEEWVETFTAA